MAAAAAVRRWETELGEVGELYARSAASVRRQVRGVARLQDAVIDDACQVAWIRLARHGEHIARPTIVGWLVSTAIHEAYRLNRLQAREVSLDELADEDGDLPVLGCAPGVDEVVAQRERLHALDELSERQQRLIWLRGLGFSYAEMAASSGTTVRTVDRQLTRARRALER